MNKLLGVFLIAVMFGNVYFVLDKINPDCFGFESLLDPWYFSFSTMSSVGFGDFTPKTDIAKLAVMLQQFVLIGEILNIIGFIPSKTITPFW